jgi:hypothetical protein
VAVGVALAGGVAFAATRAIVNGPTAEVRTTDQEEADPTNERSREPVDEGPEASEELDPTTTDAAPTLTTTPPPTIETRARPARLWAGEAVLRDAPTLMGGELARFRGRDGMALEVLEEATRASGWYRVRIPSSGQEGYLFGAFVLEPAPGLCVAVTLEGNAALYGEDDGLIGAEGSGTKVLVVDGAGPTMRWEVVLPGGQRAWVYPSDFGDVRCG